MAKLTIYTATYNRAKLLPRVFDTLCKQTNKDFLWLIIDDGSTDNTQDLVKQWKKTDCGFEIRYHYKENGGVHTARDAAYSLCDTELILSLDSDDSIRPDAVEEILALWKQKGGAGYAGVFCRNFSKNHSFPSFPNVEAATYQDFVYKYGYTVDKHTVLRADIIKAIQPSPVFDGEKLVGEGFKWIQLPDEKPFLLLHKQLFISCYFPGGITSSQVKNRYKNPNGFRESARQYIRCCKYWMPRIKAQIKYITYSILLKDRKFIKTSPRPIGTVMLLPFGLLAYCIQKISFLKLNTDKGV